MLIPQIVRVPVKEKEIVQVKMAEGHLLLGIIEKTDEQFFWLKTLPEAGDKLYKLEWALDQIIKLN